MSAARHIHPDQLAMFMPAKDLIQMEPNYVDAADYSVRADFWESRLEESHGGYRGNIKGSVREEGVRKPVVLHHSPDAGTMIANGHHRIASAAAASPETLVPVQHYGSPHHSYTQAVRERPFRKIGDTER